MNIGLLPISAKPYHAGHHALVEMAAGANDEVLLYVSISDRKRKGELPISGADMKKVWEEVSGVRVVSENLARELHREAVRVQRAALEFELLRIDMVEQHISFLLDVPTFRRHDWCGDIPS